MPVHAACPAMIACRGTSGETGNYSTNNTTTNNNNNNKTDNHHNNNNTAFLAVFLEVGFLCPDAGEFQIAHGDVVALAVSVESVWGPAALILLVVVAVVVVVVFIVVVFVVVVAVVGGGGGLKGKKGCSCMCSMVLGWEIPVCVSVRVGGCAPVRVCVNAPMALECSRLIRLRFCCLPFLFLFRNIIGHAIHPGCLLITIIIRESQFVNKIGRVLGVSTTAY
jgi:hypothetical protein